MAQSPIVPKEKLSAYQRWELGSFDQPTAPDTTIADIELARQRDAHARAEGFRAGRNEGLEAGKVEIRTEAAPRLAKLDELLASLQIDLERLDRELSHEVVQLGLAVARKLVGAALKVHPEIVQGCVEDALRHVVQPSGPINVIVHPEDAAVVRAHLEVSPHAGTWALKEDAAIARGGCRIATGAGEIDATVTQRWERITAALGDPQRWID